jgi:ribosomal protein S18 acetylase RimI-like enzyme
MLTAECTNTGKVIGFCEVGMMSSPDEDTVIAPTIANLVTCPNHRRRGIAKSLLSSATRYVQQCWKEDQLALYVSHGNREALSLYKKYGFQPQSNLEQNQHNDMNDNKCYMTKRIQSQAPVMEWAS